MSKITAKPTKQQIEWHQMEQTMFITYGPAAWQNHEYDDLSTPLNEINPELLDTDQWCETALLWGAKMILFVAKHTGGFCWWQTDTVDYGVRNIPWKDGKGDVLADLSVSCKKYGLKLAVYISPSDEMWGAYIGGCGKTKDPARQESYNAAFRKQLEEVLSRYGEMTEIWFDGSCNIEVGDILEKYAPNSIIFQGPHANIRWCGTERGSLPLNAWNTISKADIESGVATSVHSTPDGDAWAGLEVDTTLYDHFWFWSESNETKRKSLKQLMKIYYSSVGRGGLLLLNSSPNTKGLIPDGDVARYREFGEEVARRFNKDYPQVSGSSNQVELCFDKPTEINHVILMEDIAEGERVRNYAVEAKVDGEWIVVFEGQQIGYKKIWVFNPVVTECVRINVRESVDTPLIKLLSAFSVECDDLQELIETQNEGTLTYDAETGEWVSRDVGKKIGQWSKEDFVNGEMPFEYDISPYIPQAGQYTISFIPDIEQGIKIYDVVAVLEGNETEGMISVLKENRRYNITRTAAIDGEGLQRTAIKGKMKIDGELIGGTVYIKDTM